MGLTLLPCEGNISIRGIASRDLRRGTIQVAGKQQGHSKVNLSLRKTSAQKIKQKDIEENEKVEKCQVRLGDAKGRQVIIQ